MSLPLTPSPPNETSTLLRCSFLAYTSPHTARGDSVEAGAEKPTGLCAAASYITRTQDSGQEGKGDHRIRSYESPAGPSPTPCGAGVLRVVAMPLACNTMFDVAT